MSLSPVELRVVARVALIAALLACSILACAPGGETPSEPAEPAPDVTAAGGGGWEKGGIRVTRLAGSPEFPGARLAIAGPDPAATLEEGEVAFTFDVQGYDLGTQTAGADTIGLANSAKGQHIHFIVDNQPYAARYEPTATAELSSGAHLVVAFLSRSWHESVKSSDAAVVAQYVVEQMASDLGLDGQITSYDLEAPHLIYSRPKGTYSGVDGERVMVDFYLLNTELSETGNKVRLTVDGNDFLLPEWAPYVVEGLGPGEHAIQIELVDASGTLIPGPFNDTTRTITIE